MTKEQKIYLHRKGKHNTTYTYIVSKNSIPEEYKIHPEDIVGVGSFGIVLSGCFKDTPIVAKFIPLDVYVPDEMNFGIITDGFGKIFTTEDFKNDVDVATRYGDLGITPKVYYSKIIPVIECIKPNNKLALESPKYIGVIVMERFGTSLDQILKTHYSFFLENETEMQEEILDLLKIIYNNNSLNIDLVSDVHFGNILVDIDKRKVKLLDLFYPNISDHNDLSWYDVEEAFYKSWNEYKNYT